MHFLNAVTVLADKVDPNVKPNNDFFPFMGTLRDAAGGIMSVAIVISVILFVTAAVMLVISKISKSQSMAGVSTTVLIWVVAAAALIGGASGLISWATGLKLF